MPIFSDSLPAVGRRRAQGIRSAWPSGAPGYALLGLLLAGVALRLIAILSWWPATALDDSYERFADSNPFANPLHPAGYPLILGALGAMTRELALTIFVQHLSGIVSALLLWGATRRLTGSAWAGLLPAGIVLLDPDLIFLEHSIMAESWAVLATSIGLYAAVRAFDEPEPWWRWPLLTGAVLALGVTIRTAGLLMIPVVVLALLVSRPRSSRSWWEYLRGPIAAAGAAAVVLLAFAAANGIFGERFGIRSSPGWYLYGRVAQFADCSRFTPPDGTEVLCEQTPSAARPGASWYWGQGFRAGSGSPALRYFGPFGEHDDLLGQWSKRAILAQPLDYLSSVWQYLHAYWFPGAPPDRPDSGTGLDPQLAFADGYSAVSLAVIEAATQRNLETFYNDFTVDQDRPGLEFLRDWQQVIRFGPIALSITTALTLIGLAIGTRRSRVGVLLFGIGGLALIVAPALTANYVGRYTVPMAGPLMAAAAITIVELWRGQVRRTRLAEGDARDLTP
jgi:4-amino-4-deoxy-L-arabinose transferase-like glycosyltransferase